MKSCLWKETPIEMPIQTPIIATKLKAEYSRISVVLGLSEDSQNLKNQRSRSPRTGKKKTNILSVVWDHLATPSYVKKLG